MKTINGKQTVDKLVGFIQSSFKKEGYTEAVIGLSGGVDSATSCTLTAKALGATHVYPVLLPYGLLNDQGTKDARLVIDWLKIPKRNVPVVNIQPMVDAAVTAIDHSMDDGRRGNVMARMRMVVLYDFAKALPALVVGTENKTEHLLGYYTKFGDEASDIEPLRNLYKTQVYSLARHLGMLEQILTKSPSAGLWSGQTDEGEFGFTYRDADEVLYLLTEEGYSEKQVVAKGYSPALLTKIRGWMEKGVFKSRLPHCAG